MKNIDDLWNKYITENQQVPKFAKCKIQYLDTPNETQDEIIKMSGDYDKNGDDDIFFYCTGGLFELKLIAEKGSVDFKVVDIYSFNSSI